MKKNYQFISIIVITCAAAMLFGACSDGRGTASTPDPMEKPDPNDLDGDMVPNSKDIDDDNDGLIEIFTLEQLNNIRLNLEGTQYHTASTATSAGAPTSPVPNCPTTPVRETYLCGYELMNDLDFDTDGDGTYSTTPTFTLDYDDHHPDYFSITTATASGGWLPIGNDRTHRFNAIFEGNHHTIANLTIRRETHTELGLFGAIGTDAHIRNIALTTCFLEDSSSVSPIHNIGCAAGKNYGTISASYARGIINGSGGASSIGGLVGHQDGGSIIASYADVTATGTPASILNSSGNVVGGLIGTLQTNGTVIASYASGNMYGSLADGGNDNYVGGLIGWHVSGSIIASYASGNMYGSIGNGDRIGGLVGSQGSGTILASYAAGNADGGKGTGDFVGGLVGSQGSGTILASYAAGNADGGEGTGDYTGGLVGRQGSGTILASYAAGNADGGEGTGDFVGGLVGLQVAGTITASYGFGTPDGGENAGISPPLPAGVTSAAHLTEANAGSCTTTTALTRTMCEAAGDGSAVWTSWNALSGGINAWDFGTSSQSPTLRFADYDGTGGTDYCGAAIPSKFADKSAVTCGTNGSLIPGQR